MSEMFDKSQMSETIDVPAGCIAVNVAQDVIELHRNSPYKWQNIVNSNSHFMFHEE